MAKEKWNPKLIFIFEEVPEAIFARTLAELGDLVYREFRSRQLLNQIEDSIAARSDESHRLNERQVADE